MMFCAAFASASITSVIESAHPSAFRPLKLVAEPPAHAAAPRHPIRALISES